MTPSLNEIEAMGKRAARGAGLSWGLAEEAGKAARWLTARALPGAEHLAAILTRIDGRGYDQLAPITADDIWRAPTDSLCPLVCGPALCDRAAEIAGGHEIVFGPMAQPLLLAPYAAAAAKQTGATFELTWPGVTLTMASEAMTTDGDQTALTASDAETVSCRRTETTVTAAPTETTPRPVDDETWGRLNTLAYRTFAPATEASRLAGAGAGLDDNE